MNRLEKLFAEKKEGIVSVFVTAGFPELDSLPEQLLMLQETGVDLIEVGMPFSDPLADGPVIQRASEKALLNGMNPEVLFSQIKAIRSRLHVPVVLMGYLNPVLQYGLDRFIEDCKQCGIDGLILPDVPVDFYKNEMELSLKEAEISFNFLISPQTSEKRIRELDHLSTGFLYAVSSNSITGSGKEFGDESLAYFKRLKDMSLQKPIIVGFGIDSAEKAGLVHSVLNGVIIGSAFLKAIEEKRELDFLSKIMGKEITYPIPE